MTGQRARSACAVCGRRARVAPPPRSLARSSTGATRQDPDRAWDTGKRRRWPTAYSRGETCSRSKASSCTGVGVASISTVTAPAARERTWFFVRVTRVASRVRKLCTGSPSSVCLVWAFRRARGERCAGATTAVFLSSSSNSREALEGAEGALHARQALVGPHRLLRAQGGGGHGGVRSRRPGVLALLGMLGFARRMLGARPADGTESHRASRAPRQESRPHRRRKYA